MNGQLLTDRAVGCLAGAAVGDALGGATEGWESHEIHEHFGGWVTGIVAVDAPTSASVVKPFSPFWKGDGHVTDDTLMTRVLVRAYATQARPPRRLRRRAADRAGDRRREDVDPGARPRGPALPPPLPGGEVARAEAPLRPRRSRATRASGTSSTAAPRCTSRRSGSRTPATPTAPTPRPSSSRARTSRATAARRPACSPAAVAEAFRPEATSDSVVETCAAAREGRDARRDRGGRRRRRRQLDGWRDGGLAELRRGVRAVRLRRRARTRSPAQNARIPSRLHAIEELPIALGLLVATGGDYAETVLGGVNYGRDSDSIASMGGALAGALGGVDVLRRDWVDDVSAASKIDVEDAGPRRWPRSRSRSSRATRRVTSGVPARWRRSHGRRGACLRVTWIQPEDLVGHELRQAREEGKDVDAVEAALARRRRDARRRARGASQEPAAPGAAAACARAARRARGACRGRSPTREPEGFDEILAAADAGAAARAPRRRGADRGRLARARRRLRARQARRGLPREGIRALAQATGNWPVAGGSPPRASDRRARALAVEPREPADEPRREHRRHPRGRRPQLHDARPRAARALRHRLRRRSTSRSSGSTTCRPGGSSRPSASPCATLLEAYLPPETATRPQPVPRVDRRAAARRRLRLGRRAATRAAARMAWEDARVSHTGQRRLRGDVHGRRARGLADGVLGGGLRRRRPLGRARRRSRLAEALSTRASSRGSSSGRRSSTSSTPLRRAALGARDQQHGARRGGALRLRRRLLRRDRRRRPGRLGHGHERRRGRLGARSARRRRPGSRSAGRRR